MQPFSMRSTACALLLTASGTFATAATLYNDAPSFIAATGATSFSGPLPAVGNVSGSRAIGDVTVTAPRWTTMDLSTLLPGLEIAISDGAGDNAVPSSAYNDGVDFSFAQPVAAAGFFFHEPTAPTLVDGCNVSPCVNSQFRITLRNGGGSIVGSFDWTPAKNAAVFWGVASDQPFVTMQVRETFGSDDNEFYGQVYAAMPSAVPEPATSALAIAGLLVVLLRRRRAANY